MKAVPASAKIEKPRLEDTCKLPEFSVYTVADLQSLGFGLPTSSLMKPPRSLFAAVRFSSMRAETVGGMMARMISTGPGKGDGTGPGVDAEGGGAGEREGKPDGSVGRIGVGKIGTKLVCCTMDVIVVTTGLPPGYPYGGVSRGAR